MEEKKCAPCLSEPCAHKETGFGCFSQDSTFPSGGAVIHLPPEFQLSFG